MIKKTKTSKLLKPSSTKTAIEDVKMITAEELALISQNLFTAILWVQKDGTIIWANSHTEQLFAASHNRIITLNALDLLCPHTDNDIKADTNNDITNSTLYAQWQNAISYHQPFIDHDKLICGIHQPILVDYSVTPVEQNGTVFFLIELWEKNRQSRISQEQQQQQQHIIARQMLRAVAHEVKNPLAGIRGAAQLLDKQLGKLNINDNKVGTYTNIIISETDRLTQLIAQMLGSNQLANWQQVNIHEPLEHVLTLTHSQYPTIKIVRDYDLSLPELTADKHQLIQVFLNLINNACEAMFEQDAPTSSEVNNNIMHNDADDTSTYQPKIYVQTRVAFSYTIKDIKHKQVLKVTINDNGGGIDPDMIGQIFLPLVTGRAAGTGLGLALVQDMVSRHHGAIDVISKQGSTTFTLYLPFFQP